MTKYWDRKKRWPHCYQCGKLLLKYERVGVSWSRHRNPKLKGYCRECFSVYFGQSQMDCWGNLHCCDCNKYLNVDLFSSDPERKHGKKSRCKKCDYKRNREFLKNNPEKAKGYIERHRDKRVAYKRGLSQRERDSVDAKYARRLLARYSDLTESEFPQGVVEIKIAEIKLYRALNPKKGKQFAGSLTNKGE